MKRALFFMIIFVLSGNIFSQTPNPESPSSPSQSPGIANLTIDLNQITDPALKNALSQIQEKFSQINGYSLEKTSTNATSKGTLENKDIQCFKRPNLFYAKSTNIKHIVPFLLNSVNYYVVDGEYLWECIQNAPGSGKLIFQKVTNIPKDKMDQFVKQHEQPKVMKYNLAQLFLAGRSEREIIDSSVILNPFYHCDIPTIKLEQEDSQTWMITAKPNKTIPGANLFRFTFGKQDGVLQKLEHVNKEGKADTTEIFANIQINPSFPQNQFTFNPPQGVEVKDLTAEVIHALQKEESQPPPQP
jgi:outer membrane lipoprotein-sorting protein